MIITLHYFNMTMKKFIIVAIMAMFGLSMYAQDVKPEAKQEITADDYKIISDEVADGIRYVTAAPSALVCSKQIDIQIKDGVILSVVYTRGCDGNAKGIGALIKDMTVEEAIRRLEGITCGKRPTSGPDQLAKVLRSL